MRLDAHGKRPGFTGSHTSAQSARASRARCRGGLGTARIKFPLTVIFALAAASAASAQQPLVIGGGAGGSTWGGGGGVSTIGGGGSGVVVNSDVLDSLGPAPGLPYAAPQTPVLGSPIVPPRAQVFAPEAPGAPATAYRLPGSGQLMVTRPATLLHPPLERPKSRLTVPTPSRAPARAVAQASAKEPDAAPAGGKLKSRLVAAPPEPAARALEPAPKSAREFPPAPAAPKPLPQTATAPATAPSEAPAKPAMPAPSPPAMPAKQATAAPSRERAAERAPATPAARATVPPAPPTLTEELRTSGTPSVAAPSVPPIPAAPKAPAAETASASKPTAVQGAARTVGVTSGAGNGDMRLQFDTGSAELTDAARGELQGLVQRMSQDSAIRVQLLAYATENGEGASRARRLSLSRALAVRAFLIDHGIRSTRMDVRALGSKTGDGPADRVDILPQ